jgi:hypothetical protein
LTLLDITWDEVLTSRASGNHLPAAGPENVLEAIANIREVFGEDVTELPYRLLANLLNQAPWTHDWLVWLSRSLARVQPVSGYAELRHRLIDPERFGEACSVLDVGERLLNSGLLIAFDEPVKAFARRKVPDIRAEDCDTGETLYCEVSVLFTANAQAGAMNSSDQITNVLFSHGIDRVAFAGGLARPISDDEASGLAERVRWELMEIDRGGTFREVIHADTIKMALAPIAEQDRVRAWAEGHGMELGRFSAAMPIVDVGNRLLAKIAAEAVQLPEGHGNVLAISLFEPWIIIEYERELLSIALEGIRGHSNVSVLVLVHEGVGMVERSTREVDGHLIVTGTRAGLTYRHMVLKNPNCATPPSPLSTEKVRAAFQL